LIFQTDKQIKEYGDKIPADKKEAIEAGLAELRSAHQSQNVDAIDAAMTKLNEAWAAASQDMYAATQAQDGAAPQDEPSNNGGGANDTVTDAEYEEVK
jgi:molecular chaperone DnaK